MIGGDPALRTLARLKFKGALRKTARRLKSLSGLLFMAIGGGFVAVWLVSIYLSGQHAGDQPFGLPDVEIRVLLQVLMAFFTVVSLSSAVNVPGLYLPKGEIEALFAAPVRRQDLVRYRMRTDVLRTLIGGVIFGLILMRRVPVPLYGFLGTLIALQTLVVVRQLLSLLLCHASDRFSHLFRPKLFRVVAIAGGIGLWVLVMAMVMGGDFLDGALRLEDSAVSLEDLLTHTATRVITAPFYPQASMIAAATPGAFALWFGVSLVEFLALFELTARLPIDFRERSLETSDLVADRLNKVRRGGLFGTGPVDAKAASKRVPWYFGRGPFGAVAWIKVTEILRKGRRGLITSLVVVAVVTLVITFATRTEEDFARIGGPLLIAGLAVLYLSGSMRVDFRGELDRMERIKGWPLAPRKLFAAILVPQVSAITLLIVCALVVRAALLDLWHPIIAAITCVLPFVAFAWMAVDNLVFLFKPVRFVPGQEGTLHHTGRAMVLFLLRMGLFAVTLAVVSVFGGLALYVSEEILRWDELGAIFLVTAAALPVFAAVNAGLCIAGGALIRRFDVTRETG